MVLEINLDHLVRKTEHYSMTSSHPLLDVDYILYLPFRELIRVYLRYFSCFRFLAPFKVASEMLEESDLLLKLLWILCQSILFPDILTIGTPTLIVIEVITVRI